MTTVEAHRPSGRAARTRLWWAGLLTLVAAAGLPRLNDYISPSENGGRLDRAELIFLIVIAVVTVLLFGVLARWAVQAPPDSGRPARVGLVCSVLGLVGILAFYLSAPIILGGLGATLGYEARKRRVLAGHGRMAVAALVIGGVAALIGIVVWLVG
jgi:uncharacterized membrane protein YhaH (DUF805 family)